MGAKSSNHTMTALRYKVFMKRLPLSCLLTVALNASAVTPMEIFENRIMPIFKSPNPSSCVQCHLSAVDLKDYILPSSDATFASL